MADTLISIEAGNEITAAIASDQLFTTTSDLSNPAVVETLQNVGDVDVSTNGKLNGSILVYKTITNKWTSTTTLDAQNMEGGFF